MRVGLVVPVALPCTPRGCGQGAVVARGRRAAARTGPPGGYTSHTSATRTAVASAIIASANDASLLPSFPCRGIRRLRFQPI